MRIWVLTHVKRGFIQEPEIFYNGNRANRRRQKLSKDLNPDYDELAIFEKEIAVPAAQQPQ
jgi:ribosome-associated protein YbcJ (S4-like RNA binding protein)